jgi:LPXTG-site transpeptidase (sortase) family protein
MTGLWSIPISFLLLLGLNGCATAPVTTTATTVYSHPISDPVRIVIPAIHVDVAVVPVGVADDGSMEIPEYTKTGWFKVGPAPGAPGPSVIVGHVSSKKGRGAFYSLSKMKPGDEFYVYRSSGTRATFVVVSTETVLKTKLPTKKIWNDTQESVIRLVTCGGQWDKDSGHYLSNVIVYGKLVAA